MPRGLLPAWNWWERGERRGEKWREVEEGSSGEEIGSGWKEEEGGEEEQRGMSGSEEEEEQGRREGENLWEGEPLLPPREGELLMGEETREEEREEGRLGSELPMFTGNICKSKLQIGKDQ